MPTAREGLLDAAYAALGDRPWAGVRMVDVAAAAGVSRQTLYNEFGSKDGLAQALLRREAAAYLAGVERALADAERSGADIAGRLAALGEWTLRTARANPLVRAVLTGCWGARLPVPQRSARTALPGQRGAGQRGPGVAAPVESPAEMVDKVCERAVAALAVDWPGGAQPAAVCEHFTRITLSLVVAPGAKGDGLAETAAALLAGPSSVAAGARELQADDAGDDQ
ncbi:TetR/AcrR family transcriptional regulator [Streptomyces polyrhachis]|uniref:TetR/AcrR family transcriptional regulator n=1 Tax=Streptomyces polyrhachis TaxID=1282885 RepID=A0ABW2GGM0_9ACTN